MKRFQALTAPESLVLVGGRREEQLLVNGRSVLELGVLRMLHWLVVHWIWDKTTIWVGIGHQRLDRQRARSLAGAGGPAGERQPAARPVAGPVKSVSGG